MALRTITLATTGLATPMVTRQPVISRSRSGIGPIIHTARVTGPDRVITRGTMVTGTVITVIASGSTGTML